MTRIVLIGAIILIAMFGAHSVYYRGRTETQLNAALKQMSNSPAAAYAELKAIHDYNNAVTLGRKQAAYQRFLGALESHVMPMLQRTPAPDPMAYVHAAAAVAVLQKLEQATDMDLKRQSDQIARAVVGSVPRTREHGVLAAWRELLNCVDTIRSEGVLTTRVVDDPEQFVARLQEIPIEPMGRREAIRNTVEHALDGLQAVGFAPPLPADKVIVEAPSPVSDWQLMEAEKALTQGLEAVGGYLRAFPDLPLPAELHELSGKIIYNKAALKLTHLQEAGMTARRTGTTFIADSIISPNTGAVPTAFEMYDSFVQGCLGDFQRARDHFEQAGNLSPDGRSAYVALTLLGEARLQQINNVNVEPQLEQVRRIVARLVNPTASRILATAQQSGRPVLITAFREQ